MSLWFVDLREPHHRLHCVRGGGLLYIEVKPHNKGQSCKNSQADGSGVTC